MSETVFYKFTVKRVRNEYAGTYEVYDDNENLIARSHGIHIHRRHILYESLIEDFSLRILRKKPRIYVNMNGDGIHSKTEFVSLLTQRNVAINSSNKKKVILKYDLFMESYTILDEYGSELGKLSCGDWKNDIGVVTSSYAFLDELFCAIITIGYIRYGF